MANVFDQFDKPKQAKKDTPNVFDQFDAVGGYETGPLAGTSTVSPSGEIPPGQTNDQLGGQGAQMLRNLPGSAYNYGKNLMTPIVHPIETFKSLKNLAKGTFQKKLVPGEQPEEAYFDAMVQDLAETYGGVEKIQETIVNDPFRIIGALGAIISGAGAVTGLKGASVVGAAIEPLSMAKTMVVNPLAKALIPKKLPSDLYAGATKFSTVIPEKKRSKMVDTALKHEIMPTAAGVDKVRTKIDDLNNAINSAIDNSANSGGKVNSKRVFQNLKELRRKLEQGDAPETDLAIIDKIAGEIGRTHTKKGWKYLDAKQLQELKTQTYKKIYSQYGELKTPTWAKTKAEIARAAKSEIEGLIPDIKGLNLSEGELLELLPQLERSASRISNRDVGGIGLPIKASAGGIVGDTLGLPGVGSAAGVAAGILDVPTIKARLAIILDKTRKGSESKPWRAMARQAQYEAGKTAQEIKQEQKNGI